MKALVAFNRADGLKEIIQADAADVHVTLMDDECSEIFQSGSLLTFLDLSSTGLQYLRSIQSQGRSERG